MPSGLFTNKNGHIQTDLRVWLKQGEEEYGLELVKIESSLFSKQEAIMGRCLIELGEKEGVVKTGRV